MGESSTRRARENSKEHQQACSELAVLLEQHQEEIATAWADKIRGLPGPSCAGLSPEEVCSLTERGVAAIAESLETGSVDVLDEYLAGLCAVGSETAPDASTLSEALLLCKEAALRTIRDACGSEASATWSLVTRLDECLRYAVGRVSRMCSTEMAEQLSHEKGQVATLLDVAQTVTSTLELAEVVSRVSEAVVTVLGVDRCTFYLVDEEQRSALHVRRPSDWSSRTLRPFQELSSLFHEVLRRREPVTVYDGMSDPRIPSDYVYRDPETKSGVVVPLLVKGKVVAMAGAYTVHDYRGFSDEEIALAQAMGNVLGLVIRNSRLYEALRKEQWARGELLAKTIRAQEDERKRIARELHDQTTQDLAALMLSLDTCVLDVAAGTSGSQQHLDRAKSIAGTMLEDTRRLINDLRPSLLDDLGLASAIAWYGEQRLQPMGVALDLEYDQMPARLPALLETALFRITQEALTNVARHADASRVKVTLRVDDHAAFLTVRDNGRGFEYPVKTSGPAEAQRLGLRGMRERVSTLGGEMRVESEPGRGTAITVSVPLPPQEKHGV